MDIKTPKTDMLSKHVDVWERFYWFGMGRYVICKFLFYRVLTYNSYPIQYLKRPRVIQRTNRVSFPIPWWARAKPMVRPSIQSSSMVGWAELTTQPNICYNAKVRGKCPGGIHLQSSNWRLTKIPRKSYQSQEMGHIQLGKWLKGIHQRGKWPPRHDYPTEGSL